MGGQCGEPSRKLFLPETLAGPIVVTRNLGANWKSANGARAFPSNFAQKVDVRFRMQAEEAAHFAQARRFGQKAGEPPSRRFPIKRFVLHGQRG